MAVFTTASRRWPVWIFPVVAIVLVAAWQWATVTANYNSNETALFCTGALQQQSPLAASEHIYLFANSAGYDGQFYHYVAHDPLPNSDLKPYLDDARLRYRRVFIPLLAYLLALGNSGRIDAACELVCLLTIGLGVFWSCQFAQRAGLAAAWGLAFLAMPAIPITVDRLVIDGGLAALTAAFLYYSYNRPPSWTLFAILACEALTRETGFFLVIAYCAHLAWRRDFWKAGLFLMSAGPAAVWYGYVQASTAAKPNDISLIPFAAILDVLRNPWTYPPGTPFAGAVVAADYLALAGVLLALGLAFFWFARGPVDPGRLAAALFATMAVVFQRPLFQNVFQNVYDFGRVYTPVLLCLAAIAAQKRNPWLLMPVAMMLPRIAIQLTPQVLGIIHWIA
jgi:hypothetical protein